MPFLKRLNVEMLLLKSALLFNPLLFGIPADLEAQFTSPGPVYLGYAGTPKDLLSCFLI